MVGVWFLAFWKFWEKMVLIFTRKNKNYSSCYKQEWELFGSYFGLFSAYFSLFWLFSANFGLFRVNGSYFFGEFWFLFFIGYLSVFSLRTMVLIKKSVMSNMLLLLFLKYIYSHFDGGGVVQKYLLLSAYFIFEND